MKSIYCTKCGDEIQQGYSINPASSEICDMCYNEQQDKLREEQGNYE